MIRLRPSTFVLLLAAACGGGGGGGSGVNAPGPVQPPPPVATVPSAQQSGIVGAAGGAGTVRIDCALPGIGFEAALFHGASASTVYSGAPSHAPLSASPVLVTGLADGTDRFFGLAIRATGATGWTPVGSVVRTRPGAPLFVDASANPAVADGQTPATAFPNLQDALLVAGSQNGRNVWIRAGDYAAGPYALGPNVHAAGGFDATFSLAARSATGNATRLVATATQEIVYVQCGGADGSLDGLTIDGNGAALKGIDVVDSDVELRALSIRRCTDRGVKCVVTAPTPNRSLQIVACTIQENGSDGLSAAGPIDVRIDLSQLDANGQEGADLDDLRAPDNGSVSLRVTGSRFFGNVFEGLDVDLAAAPLSTGTGTFDVLVENCRFEQNGLDGVLIDQEHEFFPGFHATITIRGCIARANRGAGVHVDADAAATYRLEQLRCTANAGDGLLVTAETHAGEVFVHSCWFAANLGAGARLASGNKTIVASHCAFAGNRGGGLRSDSVPCAAAASVFLRQTAALTNATGANNVVTDDSAALFVAAPTAFAAVTTATGGTLVVDDASGFAAGTSVQAGDDGVRLVIAQQTGTTLVLDAAPARFVAPGALTAHDGASVADDLRLAAGSPAATAGLAAPGDPVPDAGPHGAAGGGEPGHVDPVAAPALHALRFAPAIPTGLTASASLVITFDRILDVASVTADRVRVLRNGTAVAFSLAVSGATLTLTPTSPGWSGPLVLQLLPGLRGADGAPLAAAVFTPLRLL
ncbi:MAG: right-handed parallel beta-helix repeat-containing protein [Planctomycetes bacterium]|nr:right-handed parallel beta-helix repeat-containing protein [Planctomycetota bacterium]